MFDRRDFGVEFRRGLLFFRRGHFSYVDGFERLHIAAPVEVHVAGFAVTVFGDEHFYKLMIAVVVVTCGELAFFRLRIFDLFGTMQEHYHIGVLFDCARFAKVGKLRFFPALLGAARQLRKHQKRHAEFFCIKFHLTAHRRDFLLAVFGL